ncbi:MAG: stage V sporulation protein AC [Oscillospiraceae bacterium]|nr:stage V sporulation protein AC [Oscillospiraceae bacterium]
MTSPENYKKMVEEASPNSKLAANTIKAFLIGGLVCILGELFYMLLRRLGLPEEQVRMLVPVTLIGIAVVLTALGIYDKIARHAGAGTIVPITGFANAVASPAMEFQSEGRILGTGANIFKMAGPVIVFGVGSAVVYGVVYWLLEVRF